MGAITIYQLAGYVGVAFYVGSYAALQLGWVRGRGFLYAFMNLMGASLVLVSLIEAFNLFSMIISIVWIVISVVGLIRNYLLDRVIRFTAEERRVLDAIAPDLDKPNARTLINLGAWVDGTHETQLSEQGQPISHLYWVASGQIAVYAGGRRVAEMGAGSVLGEATALNGAPATATLRVDQAARYFCIPAPALRLLAQRNAEIRAELQHSFSAEMRNKLEESNMRMVAGPHDSKAAERA